MTPRKPLIRDLQDFPAELRGGAVSIGNFDGVHRGHARIIERLRADARRLAGPAIVFTFDPHPIRLLRPDAAPPPLTWTERKVELLTELGIDAMIAYPTDDALLRLTPQEFFQQIVLEQLDARAMVEGPNFFFGRGRAGNVEVLRGFCLAAGISLDVIEPLLVGDDFVSSSRVRGLISLGRVREAAELLTRPYRIRGMVTHGAGRGAKLGFPTANVAAIETLLPALGVYAGLAHVAEREGAAACYRPAAINIGPNPTFGEQALKVEVHLLDFHDSLYGQPLEVDFLDRLRDICPFNSVAELKVQLARDVARTREIAGADSPAH